MSYYNDFLKELKKRGLSIDDVTDKSSGSKSSSGGSSINIGNSSFANEFKSELKKRGLTLEDAMWEDEEDEITPRTRVWDKFEDDIVPVSDSYHGIDRKTSSQLKDEEDDIAPVKEKRLDFFQKGAFEDGYQFGDVTKAILGTAGDAGLGVTKGFFSLSEGIADVLSYGMAGVADLAGGDRFAEGVRDFAKRNVVEEVASGADNYLDKYSVLGRTSDAITQGIGQFGGILATGGIGVAAGLSAGATTGLTLGTMGLSGMGSGMSEAYQGGATDEEAALYGVIAGAADALTEMVFGGMGKAINATGLSVGLSSADDILAKKVSSLFSNQIAKNVASFGIKASAEGVEEVLAGIAQGLGKKLTYMSEEDLGKILKDENLLEQFVVSTVISGLAQSSSLQVANRAKEDFVTGQTQNEQAVIKKEIENRIAEAEQDGKKLTAKEKANIEAQVEKDMEKGYISTDTIEEVLGGETYMRYKETIDSENALLEQQKALQEEFDTLNKMKQGEMTGEQIDRRTDLKEELAKLQETIESTKNHSPKNLLKQRLSESVSEIVRSDRLIESYNERTRRSQAFTADLTKYGEKQQAVIKKAIDSGILNNTNRTHEFVDMVAKISADKGVLFDFTNNQKLKDSGFAVDGKTVNGYVTKDGITVNIQSSKALNSIVGHEITHVLEGTDLYTELQNMVVEYAKTKGDYQGRYDALSKLYEGIEGANIDAELTADLVGDYLFTDADFINNLSTNHRNVFQKIYDEVKYLLKVATAGSKEAKELEKVKRAFEKAYREGETAQQSEEISDTNTKYSIREEAPPKETGVAYKVFYVKDGKLYPPMVANPDGADTPMGVWLNADMGTAAPPSKTGRAQVKAGGKGTQGGSGSLAFRPGWHLGDLPRASQFDRVNPETGKKELFPENFVWAEVEYAKDVDYQEEAMSYGYTDKGKFRHAYAGLPRLPENGYYRYRTNPKPDTVPWVITGAMKVNRLLSDAEVNAILEKNGVPPVHRQGGDVGLDKFGFAEDGTVKYSLANDGNGATFKGRPFWSGSVSLLDGVIEEVHTYKQAENADFHHSNYFSPGQVEKMANGENGFFWVDRGKVYGEWRDSVPKEILDSIEQQIVKYSLSDSNGRQLSNEQQEYFKDSVVRDENGNLKVMYHGTSKGGHTVFDTYGSNYGLFGQGSYFTDSKDIAQSYTKKGKGKNPQVYEAYLNIKNPIDMDAPAVPSEWQNAFPDAQFPESGTNEDFYRAMEEYFEDNEYSRWEAAEVAMDALMGMGYDGITHIGGGRVNADGERHQVYIAFEPEQIKNIDNAKPTADPDIRYSLSTDSDGNNLSDGQKEYFKDSKVVDKDGNLLKVYHGTTDKFNTFRQNRADGWGTGIYFTDNKAEATTYGENVVEAYLNITNPYNADTMSYDEIGAENTKAYRDYDMEVWKKAYDEYDTYEEYKADGQGVDMYDIYVEEVEVFNKILRELGYDGIIADGSNGIDGLEIVAFRENQPKLTSNQNPTEDADIRYSLSEQRSFLDWHIEQTKNGMRILEENRDITKGWAKKKYTELRQELDVLLAQKHPAADDFLTDDAPFPQVTSKDPKERLVLKLRELHREIGNRNYSMNNAAQYANGIDKLRSQLANGEITVTQYDEQLKDISPYYRDLYDQKQSLDKEFERLVKELEELEGKPWKHLRSEVLYGVSKTPSYQYSLSKDNEGKQLSKEQAEYFKNSKMRDDNGNLKVMYHGSKDGGFHVFDPHYSDDNTSFFFTDSNEVASSYSGTSETYEAKTIRTADDMRNFLQSIGYEGYEVFEEGENIWIEHDGDYVAGGKTGQELYEEFCWYEGIGDGDVNYKVYLNLENPLVVDAHGNEWDDLAPIGDNNSTYEYIKVVDYNYNVFTEEENITIEYLERGSKTPVTEEFDPNNFPEDVSEAVWTAIQNGEEIIRNVGLNYRWKTRDYAQYAKENGYDGVIFNNIDDIGGYGGTSEVATVAIAFDSNQIKSVANTQPTGNPDIRYSLSEDSTVKITDSGSVTKFSLSTWTPETQEKVRNNLTRAGFEKERVDRWIKDTNSVAAVIAADKDRLDFEAADNQTMLKNNQEYVKTLDASTLCAKRLVYQGTFDAIQHRMPNTVLTSDDLIDLLNMMKEKKVQTPCGVCYVESRRRHLGKFAQEWLDGYDGEYKPNLDEVTTSDGLEALRKSHPDTYDDFIKAMNKKGSSNPKVVQLRTEYRNEIMSLTPSQIRKIESIGGLRVQSFSDFETPHLLDMMQAVMDMSAKGLSSQAYTKVPNFAWVFGDTGIKINLSLIAEGNGFDADGNLAFSSVEGMDINEAMKLRDAYSQNVGTIIVGANDQHILACMADDRIDYIIPFHRSGWGQKELGMMGMDGYTDYTYGQNEHSLETGKGIPNLYPPDYWDYNLSGKENAERYLNLCARTGREPKFSQFLVNNGDGSYSLQPDGSTDGYWKMLIDFKMYDNAGNGVAQQKVQPNFNMDEAYRVLGEYEGGANKLPVATNVVEEFVAKYQAKASISKEGTEHPVYGNYNVYGKDVALETAPVRETVSKTTGETKTPVSQTNVEDLFPDDLAPVTEEESAAMQEEALSTLTDADMPPEVEAPYPGEPSTPSDPFADRDIKDVGNRNVNAYMYENPEVKPFFQSEANIMLGELRDTVKGERIYQEDGSWTGTSRYTSEDIAYLRDELGYSYAEIEKGLNAIIEDNGKENIAVAKRIEFILNDRLGKGYTDFNTGMDIPADQDYINLLNEKRISEYSEEAFARFMETADQYIPSEDVAPVAAKPATSEAPKTKQYEAIRPKKPVEQVDEDIAPVFGDKLVRVDSNNGRPGEKQRKWVGTSTGSEAVDGKVIPDDLDQDLIHYQPISNKQTLGNANARLSRMGYDASVAYLNSQFANNRVTLDDIALGERLIQEAVKKGDTKTAADLIMDISILGTELGQKVQALSIIKRLTPEGQLKMLQKTIERGKTKGDMAYEGVELTQEMIDKILKVYGKDGSYDQAELNKAVEEVKKDIADQMKVTGMDKVNAWRYLSMLGNPKTHIRNLVSNVAMRGTVAVKNVVARTIETVAPIQNRTKTWKVATDDVKRFAKQTTAEMKGVITGDSKYSTDVGIKQNRQIFKSKILNGLYEFNSNMLEKEDWWFSKPAFTKALTEFLTANGIRTQEDINNNPKLVEKAKLYATEQSQIATFRQYSWLANKINDIERHNAATQVAVGAILPFKKTPINIAKTGLNYSPLGFAKTLTYDISQVKKGNMEASELVDHLAQNVTGTALTLVGFMLAKSGLLSGAGEDDKEGKYDYQLGEQSYAINIDGKSYSLSWLSPVAMPLFVGANAYEQLVEDKEWNGDVVMETLAQTLDPLSEMSFLSGLNDVLSSYDQGLMKFAGIGEAMAQNYITQFAPTFMSQVATVMDDTKRSTKVGGDSGFRFVDETINKLKYKIPGLRQTLEPTTDIWGNNIKQSENVLTRAFETFLAPYATRTDTTTRVDEVIKGVYGETGEDGVIPNIPNNYVVFKNEKYKMSAEDFTAYKKAYGQTAYNLLEDLFATDTFYDATPADKANLMEKVYDYALDEAKKQFLAKQGIEYTNATKDDVPYYKENAIKGAISNDMTPEEYTYYIENPDKYAIAESVGGYEAYAEYREAMADMKLEEKVDYVAGLNLTTQQKNILINGETDRKEPIDLTGYENFSNFEQFEYAQKNPGKYAVSRAVADDFSVYYQINNEINDIKEKNDSSSGTQDKDLVKQYIFGLDLDYGQQAILFRSLYDSKADKEKYNMDIVDYLNSRDDISYEEMNDILLELGFEVDAEGNIYW